MNIQRICSGLPVAPVVEYVKANPTLWDHITERQTYPGTVHGDTKCIFLRWCPDRHAAFHSLEAVDYPDAYLLGPAVGPLLKDFLAQVPHEAIGRIILVSLKAGGSIAPHFDGGNYAERYDRFHIALQSDAGNEFQVGSDLEYARPGEAFWFNVKQTHSVRNNSSRERLHLIIDLVTPQFRALRGTYFQRERAQDLWEEIDPLLQSHWEEIASYPDIPLEPDAELYNWMEDHDRLRCYTARVGGRLVGYGVFVSGMPHYKSSNQIKQDVLFVLPEYRKRSIGYRLIRFCDSQCKAEGRQVIFQHVKAAHREGFARILEAEGYELMDLIYAKRLDRE